MRVAIVITAFNIAGYLRDAIMSVLVQSYDNWSLVVVDDGSTDQTAAVAASFHDPRIRVIRQSNGGVSAARNLGIESLRFCSVSETKVLRAGQPWVATREPQSFLFLDGDDWLAAHALADLVAALASAPQAVAACAAYAHVGQDGFIRASSAQPSGCLLRPLLTRNLFANGGHVLIRRDALDAVGGFRSDLTYGEDWEFWVRLALLGEFVAVRSREPALFVRQRPGSAYLSNATDPDCHHVVLAAIYANPALLQRLSRAQLDHRRQRAEAEIAWTIGRELVRHGAILAGQRWLIRSVRRFPSLKRFALLGLSCSRLGPFRPYQTVARFFRSGSSSRYRQYD